MIRRQSVLYGACIILYMVQCAMRGMHHHIYGTVCYAGHASPYTWLKCAMRGMHHHIYGTVCYAEHASPYTW